jgi:hypothetical protein
MSLTDEQKQKVAAWIEAGDKPADVQSRLESEFGLRVTYMEVRFLIDDLKVMPKDPTPSAAEKVEKAEAPVPGDALAAPLDSTVPSGEEVLEEEILPPEEGTAPSGRVAVKVDSITRPGAMVSGNATFSDGKKVDWYLDQYGRLGMVPPEPGYRPAQGDLVEFQMALEKELLKQGF